MGRWAPRVPRDAPNAPDTLRRLVRETFQPLDGQQSAGELAIAARVLGAAVDTLQDELLLVDPDVDA